MAHPPFRVILADAVSRALSYEQLVPQLEDAFRAFSARDGSVQQPRRSVLPLEEHGGVLCILGAGKQAESHYYALMSVHKFNEVRLWSRTRESCECLVSRLPPGIQICPDAESAVCGADVVVTVTMAMEPILKGCWIKPGAHINVVGACRPNWREVDDDAMRGCTLYVDDAEAARNESGDVMLSGAKIFAELGEVISGRKPSLKDHTTIFKSLGLAFQDAVAAKIVYDNLKDN
uniref:Crystallin, mu n=1 Tax=Eptatretus burgeri TaxID=7764 RepID=A0A8C4QK95_EPTBU